jgi:hypothetical protein
VHRLISGLVNDSRFAIITIAVSCFTGPSVAAAAQQGAAAACRPSTQLVQLPGLAEASGLALSRKVPGRLWAHNDSGEPVLHTLDARGKVTGQVLVTGATVEDWEAIAVGPCASGSCLYVGDIGDNEANRRRITVYRMPEPDAAGGAVAAVEALHASYPDGAHDAEALLVDNTGRLYVVTKGETGPVGIYRFPAKPQEGSTMKLERVGETASKPDADSRITDGAVSPDGQWAVLRSKSALTFYRASDLLAGQWRSASTVDLRPLKEAQGEGVALGAGNEVFVAGEGGGKNQPGTFARFTCASRG